MFVPAQRIIYAQGQVAELKEKVAELTAKCSTMERRLSSQSLSHDNLAQSPSSPAHLQNSLLRNRDQTQPVFQGLFPPQPSAKPMQVLPALHQHCKTIGTFNVTCNLPYSLSTTARRYRFTTLLGRPRQRLLMLPGISHHMCNPTCRRKHECSITEDMTSLMAVCRTYQHRPEATQMHNRPWMASPAMSLASYTGLWSVSWPYAWWPHPRTGELAKNGRTDGQFATNRGRHTCTSRGLRVQSVVLIP